MKKLYKLNLVFVIITLALYLTIYLGMLFSMVLGFVQVTMNLFMLYHFKTLTQTTKVLFTLYVIPTTIILVLILQGMYGNLDNLIEVILLPMTLALFHLYITHRIKIGK